MNLETFLKWLRRTQKTRTWEGSHRIRSVNPGMHCPITAVCVAKIGRNYSPGHYRSAAFDLDLDYTLSWQIADAADNAPSCDQRLRAKLLRAVGL